MIGRGFFRLILITIVFFDARLSAQTLHMCSDPVEYSTCTIVCITPDHTQTVAFYKLPESISAVAQCIPSVGCYNSSPYNITQPNATATALQFLLTRNITGSYRCSYESDFVDETLNWGTFPEDVVISGLTNGTKITSDVEFNVTLRCLYSEKGPTVLLHYEDQTGKVDAKSDVFSCSNPQSPTCGHDDIFTTYDCPCKVRHKAGIECTDIYGVNGYIQIAYIDTMVNTSVADNITFKCPTSQTSTVFLTERIITTTNYINEYIHITVPLTSESVSATSVLSYNIAPSNFVSEIITANSFLKLSSRFLDGDISNSSLILISSDNSLTSPNISEIINIHRSHVTGTLFTSPELRTETTLSFPNSTTSVLVSNSSISSFDTLTILNLFSSEIDYVFSPHISETSFLGTDDVRSEILFSFTDGRSGTIAAITKPPDVLFTSRSTSSVNFYSTPFSTIAVKNISSKAVVNSFENIDFTVEDTSVLTSHIMTPHFLTSYTSNIGTISETKMPKKESFFIRTETYRTNDQHVRSDSVQHVIHSNVSSDFSSYTMRATHSITSTDTQMLTSKCMNTDSRMEKYSSIIQTYTPDSNASVSNKQLFLSESSTYLSTISLSDMTFKASFFESSIYISGIKDDIKTTNVQHLGTFSSTYLHPERSISSSVSMITSDALMPTSIHASHPRTTNSQRIVSGFLQSSFYPTGHVFSSSKTEYLFTTMLSAHSRQVSSTDKDISTVDYSVETKGIVASEIQPSVSIVQNTNMSMIKSDSCIETTVKLSYLDSKSEFKHLSVSTMSDHSFSIRTADNLLISTQSTVHSSMNDLLYGSDTFFLVLSSSVLLLSDSISTTIHSTSTTTAGVSETTKNIIFISFVSVIIVIISVASIILLARVILKKRNITFKEKSDNVSLDIDGQSVRQVFKEFPYTERSVYPRFSNTVSSYMTSPYDQNWNEV